MIWYLALLGTLVAFQFAQFIYAAVQALVGKWAGAALKEVSLGWGPTVWQGSLGSWPCVFKLLPLGCSTTFFGEDDQGTRPSGTKLFSEISAGRRSLIHVVGPISSILIGAGFLLLPVVVPGPQVVVNPELPAVWPHSGVPGLTATKQPSTIPDQAQLFQQTAVVFTLRVVTWQSLEGWGGYIAWLVTCTNASQYSLSAWSTCFGTVVLWLGLMNLLPVTPLNGGHLLFNLLEVITGRRLDTIRLVTTYVGLLCILLFFACLFQADALWLLQTLRHAGT